jgi:signal transduction histidine kinase
MAERWGALRPLVRAEIAAGAWECFSLLLFWSAVFPVAFHSPWPAVVFAVGTGLSIVAAGWLVRRGRRGLALAAGIRVAVWLLSVTPMLPRSDVRVLVACFGFGLMAGALRRAVYRRLLGASARGAADEARARRASPVRMRVELRPRLGESAMVAGILGGHVLMLFSVAFLRTASKVVFRAWWEIIPALAILATAAFTLAVRPTTDRVLEALRLGPRADRARLRAGLAQAMRVPERLGVVNLVLWLVCTGIGVFYFRTGPQSWSWADAVMQLAYASLFAWGVSFYQRGWHEDAVAPAIERLRAWLEAGGTPEPGAPEQAAVSIRQRLLGDFGLPVLFALALSLLSALGLYRTLGEHLSLREDFNAVTALCASFTLLVLAVGGVFVRAARRLTEPLAELERAADRVAAGHLDAAVPRVEGPREVVHLGQRIEQMRQALARTIEELRAERAGLESRVERRTAELRRALDDLKEAQTALIQGERMALLGELLAGVAHEIYNPLTAIAGSISSLERVRDELAQMMQAYRRAEALLPPEERAALERTRAAIDLEGALADLVGVEQVVRSATRRSVDIVANLKSFSRAPIEAVPTDLHDGLRETLGLLGHRIRESGVEVVERFGELPLVTCRSGEIHQVFMNLLSNALHATSASNGSGARCIQIETRAAEGGWIEVAVADGGPGVPAGLREKIFDPFFTTKARGEGTGLGLSISREILRRHGGSLRVEDAPPPLGGACFVVRLPSKPA